MCDPISMAVVGAATGLAQYQGQRQQARQQARYQASASAAERARFLQEQSSIRMRQAQEREATDRELGDIAMKSREAIASARTSAGESGVAGSSVDALMDDYMRQEGNYRTALTRQQEFQNINTGLALSDAGFRTQNNQIGINKPINKPSFLTHALSTASSAMGGYRTGLEIQNMRGNVGSATRTSSAQYSDWGQKAPRRTS